jgi:hypothetical protein
MKRPGSTATLVIAIAVGTAVALFVYFEPGLFPGVVISSEVLRPSATVEGDVLAVETVSGGNPPLRKEAVVKLASGETVRASIPPACVVFPGQVAKLARFNHPLLKEPFYEITESRERNDS